MDSTLDYLKQRFIEESKIELNLTLFEIIERLEDELLITGGKSLVNELNKILVMHTK